MVGAPVKPAGPAPQPPPKPRAVDTKRDGKRNGKPGPVIRTLVSLWIAWHFTAIFLAALQVPETSALVYSIAQSPKSPMRLYLNALYLNQAHSFFAPEVGPGHLIHYELFDQNNQALQSGTLPDKKEHWPRLLYHRHMMLADQTDVPTEAYRQLHLQAYARHLLRTHREAQTARLTLLAHWPLPTMYLKEGREKGYELLRRDVAQGGRNAPINAEGFEKLAEVIQRRSDLEPEAADHSSTSSSRSLNWQSGYPNVARGWSDGVPR